MAKIYVLRAPAGLIILGSDVVVPTANATFQVRKGDIETSARKGEATAHVVSGTLTVMERTQ